MSRQRVLKPSDVVVWRFPIQPENWTRLVKLGTSTAFVERERDGWNLNPQARFVARYRWMPDQQRKTDSNLAHIPDPLAPCWQLMTEGQSMAGRRWRERLTVEEAQRIALAWLDRRFILVDAETREPVRLEP